MVIIFSVNDKNFYYVSDIILYSLLNSCKKISALFYEFMLTALLKNSLHVYFDNYNNRLYCVVGFVCLRLCSRM